MIPQERLAKVIDDIMSAAKKLPVGFHERHIGIELPGTRGWGLYIYVSEYDGNPICIWEKPHSWDCGKERLWLTHFDIQPERNIKPFLKKEAAMIALIKAAPALIEWIENVAHDYMI